MTHQTPPFWTSLWLLQLISSYDSIAKPSLSGLAILSAGTAVVGYASQFDNPDLAIYLRCAALGFALWLIARTFWAGAWLLPALETKSPLRIYAVIAVLGFCGFAIPSILGSLSANGGGISQSVTQQENIDRFDNSGQEFALYTGEMSVVQAGLKDRKEQALAQQQAEIDGRGPTGVAGAGSVSNSFGSAAQRYGQAADLLGTTLSKAQAHVDRLNATIAEMRSLRIDGDLTASEKATRLKTLSSKATAEMRALLSLDPARSIRTVAAKLAEGVPPQSRANAASQARIAEISDGMQAYAAQLLVEADRIAVIAPSLPLQVTLSPAQQLLQNIWRMPGLTMAAVLMDLCGWIAVGFRVVIYQALKAKQAEENDRPVPGFVSLEDFWRVEEFVARAEEAKARIEAARPAPKRGRPRLSGKPRSSATTSAQSSSKKG